MFDPDEAHVVYAADAAFAPILGVSLCSLYESSRDLREIFVYILDGGIGAEDREKIASLAARYHRAEPRWVAAVDIGRELGMPVRANRGSPVQYARIFLARAVEAERVLYLDSDVMLRASVRELWNLDLRGRTAAALRDAFSRAYRANMGLGPEEDICNGGVLLVDLVRWREQDVERRALAFVRSRGGRVEMSDMGALNAALRGEILPYEPRFNAVTIFFDFTYAEMLRYRRPPSYYPEAEVLRAVSDPAIVHFTSSFLSARPWERGCAHPFAGEWERCAALSPWHPFAKREKRRGLGARLLCGLPRPVMLPIAGLLQARVRPLWNRLRQGRQRAWKKT